MGSATIKTMNKYYNTTNEKGSDLRRNISKANYQNTRVIEFFQSPSSDGGYSPSQVMHLALPNAPITSVRRAMSNLTKEGHLTKTKDKRYGIYGRLEYIWKLSE